MNKNSIKILIITMAFIAISCDFIMKRDNAADPGSNNFVIPEVTANFSASTTYGGARLYVNFEDQSTGDIEAWEWDFNNDGIIDSTEQNPDFTYELTGTYSVRLKVYESRGFTTDEIIKTDYIEVIIGSPVSNIVKNDFNGGLSVTTADIDNDGDQDTIGMSFWEGEIIWCENDESSWIEHKIRVDTKFFWSVIPADIDKDGDIDIISTGKYSGIYWWENRKGEDENWKDTWPFHEVDASLYDVRCAYSVDMDNDGDMDIVGASYEETFATYTNSEISWWENVDINPGSGDGNGESWEKHKLTSDNNGVNFKGIKHLTIFDPDNDGDWDIVFTENYLDRVCILENIKGESEEWKNNFLEHTVDSAFIAEHSAYTVNITNQSVYSADMDNDGDSDIVGVTYGTWNSSLYMCENSYVCWWENTGNNDLASSSWEKHIVSENLDGGSSLIAKDIDNDGDTDIACTSSENDTLVWYENKNKYATDWNEHVINTHFYCAYSLDISDIDNDGDEDIIGVSRGNWDDVSYYDKSKIVWWEIIY